MLFLFYDNVFLQVLNQFSPEWKEKLWGFTADGAAVNGVRRAMSAPGGTNLASLLQSAIGSTRQLMVVHCAPHRLQLAMKDAWVQDEYLKEVEELAQGKVWTGGQAKLNGLVDELGGLERAVSFAQRQYTDGGVAQVERWPKQEGILEKLQRVAEMDSSSVGNTLMAMVQVLRQEINNNNSSQDSNGSSVPEMNEYDATKFLIQAITNNPRSIESMKLGGVSLTMDESAAMSHLVSENVQRLQQDQLLHPSFWNTR